MTPARIETVATRGAPQAIGPYSQALVAGGFVFCSGQISLDPATGELVEGDTGAQARQVLANLDAVLVAAGVTRDDVVKTTLFLVDLDDFNTVNLVYEEFFSGRRPARSTVQVARLPRGARIEIEAVAALS